MARVSGARRPRCSLRVKPMVRRPPTWLSYVSGAGGCLGHRLHPVHADDRHALPPRAGRSPGQHPFWSPGVSEEQLVTAITRAQVPLQPNFQAAPAAARELAQQLLVRDPLRRATAADALRHRWLLEAKSTQAGPKGILGRYGVITVHNIMYMYMIYNMHNMRNGPLQS